MFVMHVLWRDVDGGGSFGVGQEARVCLSYTQSVRVDGFTTALLYGRDGASEEDDAVHGAKQVCESIHPLAPVVRCSDFYILSVQLC